MVQGFIEIACFPYGQLLSVDVDKHHDGNPGKLPPYFNNLWVYLVQLITLE